MPKWSIAAFAIASALFAVENFYEHPTYGRGIKALIAVLQAGEDL